MTPPVFRLIQNKRLEIFPKSSDRFRQTDYSLFS